MRDDVKYVHDCIVNAGGLPQINTTMELIYDYLEEEYYPSKNKRLAQWKPAPEDLYNLIVSIFTTTLTTDYLTYQAAVGKHNSAMPHEHVIDRVKTIAEVIALMCHADLIDIHSNRGEYHTITPCLVLEDIPFVDRHGTVYNRPQPVKSNWDPEQGSMLLGGRLNHHEDKICLDHINKMNSIPMALNKEFLLKYPEEPKKETAVDTYDKQELWRRYTQDAKKKYADMLTRSNRCYLNHKYCTRGRTYAVGYYISTQGSSYKKAAIELANKQHLDEIISMSTRVLKDGIFQACPDCRTPLMRNPEGQIFCPKCNF